MLSRDYRSEDGASLPNVPERKCNNRSHKRRLTHGCLFASGHHGPTVDTFERERCSLVSVLSVV
jgi:hypothetical protein